MDEQIMAAWLQKCFARKPVGFFRITRCISVMGSVRAQITDSSLQKIKATNCSMVVIPCGMTKTVQPLVIATNQSFEFVLQHLQEAWMTDCKLTYTPFGHKRRASFSDVPSGFRQPVLQFLCTL